MYLAIIFDQCRCGSNLKNIWLRRHFYHPNKKRRRHAFASSNGSDRSRQPTRTSPVVTWHRRSLASRSFVLARVVVEPLPRTMVHLSQYKAHASFSPSSHRSAVTARRGDLPCARTYPAVSRDPAPWTENRAFANYVRVGSLHRHRSRSRRAG